MTDFGTCYNETGSKCSGGPMPGAVAFRNVVLRIYIQIMENLGIYNCRPVRGGASLSTHGEGRGIDLGCNAFIPAELKAGNELAALLVQVHKYLGIQRIIWNRRQWDTNTKQWRPYHGQSPHTDHLHVELCWAAAAGPRKLTEGYCWLILNGEVEMTPEQEAKLDKAIALSEQVLASVGTTYEPGLTLQKALIKRIDTDPSSGVSYDFVEHLNVIDEEQRNQRVLLEEIKTLIEAGNGG